MSQVSRSYDALMRLTRESRSIREGSARHVDYGYDKAANVLTLTYPSRTTIATRNDALEPRLTGNAAGKPVMTLFSVWPPVLVLS